VAWVAAAAAWAGSARRAVRNTNRIADRQVRHICANLADDSRAFVAQDDRKFHPRTLLHLDRQIGVTDTACCDIDNDIIRGDIPDLNIDDFDVFAGFGQNGSFCLNHDLVPSCSDGATFDWFRLVFVVFGLCDWAKRK
jgi:hypothetical protein